MYDTLHYLPIDSSTNTVQLVSGIEIRSIKQCVSKTVSERLFAMLAFEQEFRKVPTVSKYLATSRVD